MNYFTNKAFVVAIIALLCLVTGVGAIYQEVIRKALGLVVFVSILNFLVIVLGGLFFKNNNFPQGKK